MQKYKKEEATKAAAAATKARANRNKRKSADQSPNNSSSESDDSGGDESDDESGSDGERRPKKKKKKNTEGATGEKELTLEKATELIEAAQHCAQHSRVCKVVFNEDGTSEHVGYSHEELLHWAVLVVRIPSAHSQLRPNFD